MAIFYFFLIVLSTSFLGSPAYAVSSGRQAVAATGTPETLSSTSTFCTTIVVSADEGNTDVVAVGASDVDATEASRTGMILFPGQLEYIHGRNNLNSVWVDVEVNDEAVSFTCFQR